MALFGKRPVFTNSSTISSNAGNRSDNRTSWPDMYSGGKGGYAAARGGAPRWLPAVTLVLLIAVIVLGVVGGQAMLYRSRTEETFVNRMLTECDDALSLANSLSRNGGADSNATLGRIRSDIHAIDALNEVHNSISGSYYIPPYVFTELYAIIDSYSNNLKLGNVTMQNLTDLVNGLNDLRNMLAELK